MSRTSEKAKSMLSRYLASKKASGGDDSGSAYRRRPRYASEVTDLSEAERFRRQLTSEMSKLVTDIQNGSLSDGELRDMNDRINKILRIIKHFEKRIVELGGVNYAHNRNAGGAGVGELVDADGKRPISASHDYFYFGAAKKLAGISELYEKKMATAKKRSRRDLYEYIDAEYYGLTNNDDEGRHDDDGDDGEDEQDEEEMERRIHEQEIAEWNAAHPDHPDSSGSDIDEDIVEPAITSSTTATASSSSLQTDSSTTPPTQSVALTEAELLAKKKAELLARLDAMR